MSTSFTCSITLNMSFAFRVIQRENEDESAFTPPEALGFFFFFCCPACFFNSCSISGFTELLPRTLQGSQKRNIQFWAVFCLQQSCIGVAGQCRVLLCLASLMKPWFPKLPFCMFLLSSLCSESLRLRRCQELPFGFVCRVLIANWINKLTD